MSAESKLRESERRSSLADSGEFRLAVFSINEVAWAAPGGVGFFKKNSRAIKPTLLSSEV